MNFIKKRKPVITYVILVIILAVFILPYIWILINSFKPDSRLFAGSPFSSFKPIFENYVKVWVDKYFGKYFFNSLSVATGSAVISLIIGLPSAYGLYKFKIFGKHFILAFLFATILVPPITLAIPSYFLFRDLGLLDSVFALMIADSSFNIVFVIWIMIGFFREIPHEIEESAKIDGCSNFGSFWHIALKLSIPGVVTVGIFSFIFAWNDFLFPLILSGNHSRTMTVAIPDLLQRSGTLWGAVCSEAMIHTIPIILITIFIFKNIVRGLTFGAVKG
ncbi:MAG: carbohydrate ABC transporter permease [Actinobacteria bacterium]|nr:carbohydrate ABC transporter permease [Actinomycetota bacterium]